MSACPFHLERFVDAQNRVFPAFVQELQAGRKRTHWMWFVFPQIAGLGNSTTAAQYAIQSKSEAKAYLAHPILGPRLRDCTGLALMYANRTLYEIFSTPDDLKFRSCMTLFDAVSPRDIFGNALKNFCSGDRDARTLALLEESASDGL